jgi:DNA modification methylase
MKLSRTAKQKSSVKLGDIFEIGAHRLGCGDARDAAFVAKVVGSAKITLLLTDPPYGVAFVESKEGFSSIKVKKKILNDGAVSESQYMQFTKDWLVPVVPHLASKNSAYIFNSDKMLFALRDGMERSGIRFAQLLIWIKNHAIVGRKDYLPQHELVAYGWHGTHEFKKAKDKTML